MEMQRIFKPTDKNKTPEMGQLGGSGVKSLPWAQVMTPGAWDIGPHQAPCSAESASPFLSPSTSPSAHAHVHNMLSLSLSCK